MTLDEMKTLFDYDRWADLRVLEKISGLSADQYSRNLGSSFGGIGGTLLHILSANNVWLSRWNGDEAVPLNPENFQTCESVREQWNIYHSEIGKFTALITEDKLNAGLHYRDFKGNQFLQPLFHLIQHKVNHSTYHRGQLVTMLRQLGINAVSTDYIVYIREIGKADRSR
jgi:uncharacterized damage-inducible protein DinB